MAFTKGLKSSQQHQFKCPMQVAATPSCTVVDFWHNCEKAHIAVSCVNACIQHIQCRYANPGFGFLHGDHNGRRWKKREHTQHTHEMIAYTMCNQPLEIRYASNNILALCSKECNTLCTSRVHIQHVPYTGVKVNARMHIVHIVCKCSSSYDNSRAGGGGGDGHVVV